MWLVTTLILHISHWPSLKAHKTTLSSHFLHLMLAPRGSNPYVPINLSTGYEPEGIEASFKSSILRYPIQSCSARGNRTHLALSSPRYQRGTSTSQTEHNIKSKVGIPEIESESLEYQSSVITTLLYAHFCSF